MQWCSITLVQIILQEVRYCSESDQTLIRSALITSYPLFIFCKEDVGRIVPDVDSS